MNFRLAATKTTIRCSLRYRTPQRVLVAIWGVNRRGYFDPRNGENEFSLVVRPPSACCVAAIPRRIAWTC